MKYLDGKKLWIVITLFFISLIVFASYPSVKIESKSDTSSQVDNSGHEIISSIPQRKYRIGFSNGFSGNSWRGEMLASLRQEAAKNNDVELIILDGQGNINKQVNDIENLLTQQVDAIMVLPNSSQAVEPSLKKAVNKGIKVINFNLPMEDPDSYTVYIGTDERTRGRKWAEWLCKKLKGEGNIVMLGGMPGNSGTALAMEGAEEVFKKTNIEILAYRDAYWREDRAKEVMLDLINEYPQIDGIWTDGGQVATGALKALQVVNRPLVPVTGDDYNGLFKLYMNYHNQYPDFDFAVISTPTWQSKLAFQTAISMLEGNTTEKWIKIQPEIITGIDAAQYAKMEMEDFIFVDTDLSDDVLKKLTNR